MALPLSFQEKIRKPVIGFSKFLTITGLSSGIRFFYNMSNRFLFFQSSFFKSINPDLIIDIGANSGEFIINMRSVFPDTKIIAFEPQFKTFQSLKENTKSLKNIEYYNLGLGNENANLEMYVSDFSPASSLVNAQISERKEIIAVQKLDNFETKVDGYKKILIKIDVEGFELEVLKGGKQVISKSNFIYIEVRPELKKIGCSFDDIYAFLKNEGWVYEGAYDNIYDSQGELTHFDALFSKKQLN